MKRAMMTALALACINCGKAETPVSADSGEAAAPAESAAPEDGPAPASSSLLGKTWDEKLAGQLGEMITLEGEFLGNDPESKCEYASTTRKHPAKTAWDWLIRKDGRCMSVSRGTDPREYNRIFGAPDEILDRANVGRKVRISARVAADADGRLYLEFDEGEPLN